MYELMKFHGVEEWGGALEVLFASVLGQIVVEDDATGKALLKANLSRRTAIHCLSTFRSSNNTNITQQTLDRQLGPGKAVPALDLVESDRRYMPILQHYFGGKVLCDNMETANVRIKEHFDL
jgi:chromosome segregation ATPase